MCEVCPGSDAPVCQRRWWGGLWTLLSDTGRRSGSHEPPEEQKTASTALLTHTSADLHLTFRMCRFSRIMDRPFLKACPPSRRISNRYTTFLVATCQEQFTHTHESLREITSLTQNRAELNTEFTVEHHGKSCFFNYYNFWESREIKMEQMPFWKK